MLDERTREFLRKKLGNLKNPVKILFFKGGRCEYCDEIQDLLEEIYRTVGIEYKTLESASGPYITFLGFENVQYWGIPAGYEFGAFVETIGMVGNGVSLPLNVAKSISKVREPIKIRVFVTPQCPHCPRAVISANRFAVFNKKIKAVTIESVEFPEIAERYSVFAVPKIVIERDGEILDEWEGAMPEPHFAKRIEEVI